MPRIHERLRVVVARETIHDLVVRWIGVALRARIPHSIMDTGEDGEESVVVVHHRRRPRRHLVARLAVRRETAGSMVGARYTVVIDPVAVDASRRCLAKQRGSHARVAALAVQYGMAAQQREIGAGVNLFTVQYPPSHARVASRAARPHFALVGVLVTSPTFGVHEGEILDVVARETIQFLVVPADRKTGLRMIKANVFERRGHVALFT